jgi:hypothetical protein
MLGRLVMVGGSEDSWTALRPIALAESERLGGVNREGFVQK